MIQMKCSHGRVVRILIYRICYSVCEYVCNINNGEMNWFCNVYFSSFFKSTKRTVLNIKLLNNKN